MLDAEYGGASPVHKAVWWCLTCQ